MQNTSNDMVKFARESVDGMVELELRLTGRSIQVPAGARGWERLGTNFFLILFYLV